MLEAARLALCSAGVLPSQSRMPPFTARMSGDLVILAYPEGSAFFLVKVGLRSDLRREAEGLEIGHEAFPRGVPQVLGRAVHRSFPTLVTTGIAFEPLGARAMRDPAPWLVRELAAYFEVSMRAFRCAGARMHSDRLREAFASPWARSVSTDGLAYVDSIERDVDRLATVRQHGDFYVDNLGVRERSLVILDWEDFGRECLPGFDLAQLLLSMNAFDVGRLREHTRPGGRHAWLLAAGCTATGVAPDLFLKLLPAYVALLGWMKSGLGYGSAFMARALRTLDEALGVAPPPIGATDVDR
jgi:hypothetical protein